MFDLRTTVITVECSAILLQPVGAKALIFRKNGQLANLNIYTAIKEQIVLDYCFSGNFIRKTLNYFVDYLDFEIQYVGFLSVSVVFK